MQMPQVLEPVVSKTIVSLQTIDAARAARRVHAVYFCDGTSTYDGCVRLVNLFNAGITILAKLSSDDRNGPELKKQYNAEEQMIIVFDADEKELARFSQTTAPEDLIKWIASEGPKLAAQK